MSEAVARERLSRWVADELQRCIGLSADEALGAARTICQGGVGTAAGAVTAARATPLLPDGASWWAGAGRTLLDALLEGRADETGIEELLAEPAPDVWDPNWVRLS